MAFIKRNFISIWMQLATHLAFSQFVGTAIEYIKPRVIVGKKLETISEEFEKTIEIYENIDEYTDFKDIEEKYSIRRYQAMRDSTMLNQPPNIIDHYMLLI